MTKIYSIFVWKENSLRRFTVCKFDILRAKLNESPNFTTFKKMLHFFLLFFGKVYEHLTVIKGKSK